MPRTVRVASCVDTFRKQRESEPWLTALGKLIPWLFRVSPGTDARFTLSGVGETNFLGWNGPHESAIQPQLRRESLSRSSRHTEFDRI